jgi:hypothetical protein
MAIRPGVDVIDGQSWVQDVDRRIRGKVIQLCNNQATNVKFRLVVYISPSSSSSFGRLSGKPLASRPRKEATERADAPNHSRFDG